MSALYWHARWEGSLALLPRLRITTSPRFGIGFQWLTLWVHLWLWRRKKGSYFMFDLLPHLWFYRSSHGYCVHLWWLTFQWRKWIYRARSGEGVAP